METVDGKPIFTDGPYVETKEHLGGFAVVDVPDDEAARHWAGKLASALEWPQEVHRFPGRPAWWWELTDPGNARHDANQT